MGALASIELLIAKWNQACSSIQVSDEIIAQKIQEKIMQLNLNSSKEISKDIEDIQMDFWKKNSIIINSVNDCVLEFNNWVNNGCSDFDISRDILYKSIWDMAVRKAYAYSGKKFSIDTIEKWIECSNIKQCESKNDERIMAENLAKDRMIRREEDILYTFLQECNFDYEKEKKKYRHKTNEELYLYTRKGILYLLECIFDFCEDNPSRHWNENERNVSFGRSYLAEGKGKLNINVRTMLEDRFSPIVFLKAVAMRMFNTLFILPTSYFWDLFWENVTFANISNVFFAMQVRNTVASHLDKQPPIITYEKDWQTITKTIEDYENADYSIVDDTYWHLELRHMEDFIQGLENCFSKTEWIVTDNNMPISLLSSVIDIFHKTFRKDRDIFQEILIQYIKDHWASEDEFIPASWKKRIMRNKKQLKLLNCFYQQGSRCFRMGKEYMDDFQIASHFALTQKRSNEIENIRDKYIECSLTLIYFAIADKKIFSAVKTNRGKSYLTEKFISIKNILDEYDSKCNDDIYMLNNTYYLAWNYLHETILWGLENAIRINEFRRKYYLLYLENRGFGLTNMDDTRESIPLSTVRQELVKDYPVFLKIESDYLKNNPIEKVMFIEDDIVANKIEKKDPKIDELMENLDKLLTLSFEEFRSTKSSSFNINDIMDYIPPK